MGIAQVIIIADHFAALLNAEGFVPQMGPKTPDIHFVGIDGSLPFQNPFSHQHADPAATGNAVVGAAGRNIETFQSGNRTHGIKTIGCKSIRPVYELYGLGFVQGPGNLYWRPDLLLLADDTLFAHLDRRVASAVKHQGRVRPDQARRVNPQGKFPCAVGIPLYRRRSILFPKKIFQEMTS